MRSGTPQVFRVRLLVTASTASRRIDPCAELAALGAERLCTLQILRAENGSDARSSACPWPLRFCTKKTTATSVSDDWLSRVMSGWYTFLEASGVDLLVLGTISPYLTTAYLHSEHKPWLSHAHSNDQQLTEPETSWHQDDDCMSWIPGITSWVMFWKHLETWCIFEIFGTRKHTFGNIVQIILETFGNQSNHV